MNSKTRTNSPEDDVVLGAVPKINEGIDYGGGQKLASKTVTRPTQWNIQMPLDEVVETSVKVAEHVRVQINSCGIDMIVVKKSMKCTFATLT